MAEGYRLHSVDIFPTCLVIRASNGSTARYSANETTVRVPVHGRFVTVDMDDVLSFISHHPHEFTKFMDRKQGDVER